MKESIAQTLEIRVRYYETDGQGRVHHGQYVHYFERGRVELMRDRGHSYRDFEASGLYLVVSELNIQYHEAAVFDDLLQLTTSIDEIRKVRMRHRYLLEKTNPDGSDSTIVTATSTIACIDQSGKIRALPDYLREL